MGAIGLPGDASSASRFSRMAFIKSHFSPGNSVEDEIGQFFHVMNSVEQIEGCVIVNNNKYEKFPYNSTCHKNHAISKLICNCSVQLKTLAVLSVRT
jgi:choloylglycine hydrolase